jgi:hypothetical protein
LDQGQVQLTTKEIESTAGAQLHTCSFLWQSLLLKQSLNPVKFGQSSSVGVWHDAAGAPSFPSANCPGIAVTAIASRDTAIAAKARATSRLNPTIGFSSDDDWLWAIQSHAR